MGKSIISMAIFNSYVKLPEGNITLLNRHNFAASRQGVPRKESWLTATYESMEIERTDTNHYVTMFHG